MSNTGNAVPEGWYPDPSGAPRQRYWDGSQWTEHYHPPVAPTRADPQTPVDPSQAAAHPARSTTEPARGRRRRGAIIAIVAGSVAVVLGITAFLVWGVPAMSSGANGQVQSSPDWDYDYTQPMLGLDRDHEFEFPADYDLDALAAAQQTEVDPDRPDAVDTTFAFEVYYDPAFTKRAEIQVIQYDPNEPVHILPRDSEVATAVEAGADLRDIMDGSGTWGLHNEYYLVRKVDEHGEPLAKPVVTRFTVESELVAPTVTFGTEENSGNLTMQWKPITGATDYLIVTSNSDEVGNAYRNYRILGETSDPEWSSAASQEATGRSDTPWVEQQNDEMQIYSGSSADELALGWSYVGSDGEFDYGVIATNGTNYSPYNTYDARSIAGTLPYQEAFGASRDLKDWGPSGYVEGIENVQTSVVFTSLDGTTRATTAFITPEYVQDFGDRWVLPLQGRGTQLGEWVPVLKSSVPDLAAAIDSFNAAAEAAAPSTGLPTFSVVSAPIEEAAAGLKTPPATDYPIYGSNDFTRFIAQHFIAQTPVIDITDYAGKPGMPDPYDAALEASTQNPYVVGLEGLSVDPDGTKLYATYRLNTAQAEDAQASIAAKVADVTSAVVTDGMSDVEKVTALNDWLVANADYDDEAFRLVEETGAVAPGYEYAFNAEGTLVDGIGVCGSYAAAFSALANAAGVETVVVTGDVLAGGAHAWNKVNVDGAWKSVDVTWNDSPDANRYLMIDDSGFVDQATRTEGADWMDDLYLGRYATQ